MISKKIAVEVLNKALATGADFAEIFSEETHSEIIALDNEKCETSNDNIVYGVGIRLLRNLQSVYGYTNDVSRAGLMTLAETLSKSFDGERIKTVSEGVETAEDVTFVKTIGCTTGQGYYYSKPISVDEFTQKYIQ